MDTILGDNGQVLLNGAGTLFAQVVSTNLALGDGDQISTGSGTKLIVGGAGVDVIHAGADPLTGLPAASASNHIILGDNGQLDYNAAGLVISYRSIDVDASTGAGDLIVTGNGDNTILGGVGGDTISTGDGVDTILGDNGQVILDAGGTLFVTVASRLLLAADPAQVDRTGGDDVIDAGEGVNIVVGGYGSDTVRTGAGDDTVLGDNGVISYSAGIATLLQSTDVVPDTGGDDTIDVGDGTNIVVGGVGNDKITGGSGSDLVFGDNATVVYDSSGALEYAATGDAALGGDDLIETGDGDDVAFGGAGSDTVTSAAGTDFLFGDGGELTVSLGGRQLRLGSVQAAIGAADILDGGAGNDILIAGQGADLLFGNLTDDLLFGGNAVVVLLDGVVFSIDTDAQDLVTDALFKSFNAVADDGDVAAVAVAKRLPGSAVALPDEPESPLRRVSPLLDVAVFRKLFQSDFVRQFSAASRASAQDGEAESEVGQQPAEQDLQTDSVERLDRPLVVGGGGMAVTWPQYLAPIPPIPPIAAARRAHLMAGTVPQHGAWRTEQGSVQQADAGLALGLAGLLAGRPGQPLAATADALAVRRGLLDRDAMAGPEKRRPATPPRRGRAPVIEW